MSYYIYSMGMPVRLNPERLLDKKQVKPLTALTRTNALDGSEETEKLPNKAKDSINGYEQDSSRQQVFFAQQIMSNKVTALPSNMSFDDAWKQFLGKRFRHFPVLDGQNSLAGIISDRDMLAYAASGQSRKIAISKIMTTPVLTATKDTSIREVCQVMFHRHIGALPIVNDQFNLVGIITRSDILRSMVKYGPMELWI